MPLYTSHIYVQTNAQLLSELKGDQRIAGGLFHLRRTPSNMNYMPESVYPTDGIAVIREVCDPSRVESDHCEARTHEERREPVISWWKFNGPLDVSIVMPPGIPTLAFGKIHTNHPHNPLPPLELLRYLKQISLTQRVSTVFYHHYSAYEGELANAEYAWVFGAEESVYVRHADGAYSVTQYPPGAEPRVIGSEGKHYSQPILQLVMNYLGARLTRWDGTRPYFYDFRWDEFRP